ncbi:MAG: type II toxin-antitoxin system Phd/YefM family antitoxin [Thermomicrobiales bacterium]|nr:type II toxin-antitoxin system Phd/YefM family antitoxin [Thermomicrobiales bacterium]
MEQRMSAWEARRHFGSVLRKVSTQRTSVIVESHGEPMAAVVPIEQYEAMQRSKAAAYDAVFEIADRIDLSEADAADAIERAMRETGRDPE